VVPSGVSFEFRPRRSVLGGVGSSAGFSLCGFGIVVLVVEVGSTVMDGVAGLMSVVIALLSSSSLVCTTIRCRVDDEDEDDDDDDGDNDSVVILASPTGGSPSLPPPSDR